MIHIDIHHPFQDYTFNAQLEIPSKGVISIFGPSGAGKTTLLNCISGKLSPKQGLITINDKTILDTSKKIALPIHQRGIGYVFQDPTLFPHYSVEKNLLYGAKEKNPPLFNDIIKLLGIEPLLKKRIAYLSGGEKQRIAIGRALLSSPDILLMDEPLSALDQNRKEEILSYLEAIPKQFNIPILYVTHNIEEAKRLSREFIAVNRGDLTLKTIDQIDV